MIKLVLQRLGPGRDDGLAAALQSRQQVSKRFTRAGARFDHQLTGRRQRVGNCFSHPRLALARLKTGQSCFQGTVGTEKLSEIVHIFGTITRASLFASGNFGS